MYYSEFDSFITTIDEARSFVVSVDLATGDSFQSSPYPVSVFHAVSKQIDEALEARCPVTIWNRTNKMLMSFPVANVKRVAYQFT